MSINVFTKIAVQSCVCVSRSVGVCTVFMHLTSQIQESCGYVCAHMCECVCWCVCV